MCDEGEARGLNEQALEPHALHMVEPPEGAGVCGTLLYSVFRGPRLLPPCDTVITQGLRIHRWILCFHWQMKKKEGGDHVEGFSEPKLQVAYFTSAHTPWPKQLVARETGKRSPAVKMIYLVYVKAPGTQEVPSMFVQNVFIHSADFTEPPQWTGQ